MMAYYDANPGTNPVLQRQIWGDNRWVVRVYEGDGIARAWCAVVFGREADPYFGLAGRWFRGGTLINGWSLWGFVSENDMSEFCRTFPDKVRHAT